MLLITSWILIPIDNKAKIAAQRLYALNSPNNGDITLYSLSKYLNVISVLFIYSFILIICKLAFVLP